MQNQDKRQGSIVFDKTSILSENLKIFTSSSYLIIFVKILHRFYTSGCQQKGAWDLFHFASILSYLPK